MDQPIIKPLVWVSSSYKDLLTVPDEVRRDFGYAFYLAQLGDKHKDAKPLAGFRGAGVLEVVEDHDTDTYRAAYTVRFEGSKARFVSCTSFRRSPGRAFRRRGWT